VAFLLAFTALAGAPHFFFPSLAFRRFKPRKLTLVANSDAPRETVANLAPDDRAPDPIATFRDWAARDSGASMSWAAEQPESEQRIEMREFACSQIA